MVITRRSLQTGEKPHRDIDARRRSFISQCRARGVRLTTQRIAVFQALAGDSTHPTADSVYAGVQKTMPALSLSTVYRILESLEREGLIRRVSTDGGVARFDANLDPHQHLICRVCGQMMDLDDESLSQIPLPRIQSAGFLAEELDIRIVGTCRKCRRASGKHLPKKKAH